MPTRSFAYLEQDHYYFDAACQSLRPQPVIVGELDYYTKSNSCYGRSNHGWAHDVSRRVNNVRALVLDYVGVKSDQYAVAFTSNATIALNMLIHNLDTRKVSQLVTIHKNHNSVLLPAKSWSTRHDRGLMTLDLAEDGSIDVEPLKMSERLVMITATHSNIDGDSPRNLTECARIIRERGGRMILDGCQGMVHAPYLFRDIDFDALVFSGHKMYAPSLGIIVIKKDFIRELDQYWVGGGVIEDMNGFTYSLISHPDHIGERLELGLQDYAAIFGLGAAIEWIRTFRPEEEYLNYGAVRDMFGKFRRRYGSFGTRESSLGYMNGLADYLYTYLDRFSKQGRLVLVNKGPSSVLSFYTPSYTPKELATYLARSGIMVRAGFLCTHYYIRTVLGLSAGVVRISLGLHNTIEDISFLLAQLDKQI